MNKFTKARLYLKLAWVFARISYYLKILAIRAEFRYKLYVAKSDFLINK